MRPDGTRVKEASTIVSALPYVMPRRYDAQNFITEYADMEVLRRYIQEKRREGVRIPYLTLILAAYFKAYQENPKINRFIMNSKIYQRNHFCVSFVILKTRADGRAAETSIKVFFEDGDDIFSKSFENQGGANRTFATGGRSWRVWQHYVTSHAPYS